MTKSAVFITMCVFLMSFSSFAQLKLDCNGKVVIGAKPETAFKMEVLGKIKFQPSIGSSSMYIDNSGYSSGPCIFGVATIGKVNQQCQTVYSLYFSNGSDERLKENITDIENSLSLILKLNSKRYDYKTDSIDSERLIQLKKNHAGYLAQEVVKLIPEAVLHDDSTDLYSIDYTKIPISCQFFFHRQFPQFFPCPPPFPKSQH